MEIKCMHLVDRSYTLEKQLFVNENESPYLLAITPQKTNNIISIFILYIILLRIFIQMHSYYMRFLVTGFFYLTLCFQGLSYCVSFMIKQYSRLQKYDILFIHSSIVEHFRRFSSLIIMNNAAIKHSCISFYVHMFLFLWRIYIEVELMGQVITV